MKRHSRALRSFALAAALLGLSANAAVADVLEIEDPAGDTVWQTGNEADFGDYDLDLRMVRVDHQASRLVLTASFAELVSDSWTDLWVELDTDGDNRTDHWIYASKESGARYVARGRGDSDDPTVCDSFAVHEELGWGGKIALTIPRSCIGSPRQVAVHFDIAWDGLNVDDERLFIWDSAPGWFHDSPPQFSSPVQVTEERVVPSPEQPKPVVPSPEQPKPVVAARTATKAALSAKTQRVGAPRVWMSVKVTSARKPRGTVVVKVAGRTLRKNVRSRQAVTFRLPAKLRPGKHRIRIQFKPGDRKLHVPSSTTRTIRVLPRR